MSRNRQDAKAPRSVRMPAEPGLDGQDRRSAGTPVGAQRSAGGSPASDMSQRGDVCITIPSHSHHVRQMVSQRSGTWRHGVLAVHFSS